MSYNLFIDDERIPFSEDPNVQNAYSFTKDNVYITMEWIVVKNYQEFVDVINSKGLPSFVSFDHDLGKTAYEEWFKNTRITGEIDYDNIKEETGMDCVRYLINYCLDKNCDFPHYRIHTMNPIGRENIGSLIRNYIKHRASLNKE
jgi:hypothetical protein